MNADKSIGHCVRILEQLIAFASVTPSGRDCLEWIAGRLEPLGFSARFVSRDGVDNLLISRFAPASAATTAGQGQTIPHLCFAGHVDVVPPGDGWSTDPFAALIRDGCVQGRGAADMKGAVAAFMTALTLMPLETLNRLHLSLLLTTDEEGPACYGTKIMTAPLQELPHPVTFFLIGEPTSAHRAGDTAKTGRRGSFHGYVTVTGTQGHVAYPDLASNPVPVMAELIRELNGLQPDNGYANVFPPSRLEFTAVDTGNPVSNVIPAAVTARFNVRFNPSFTGESLADTLEPVIRKYKGASWRHEVSAEPFYCGDTRISDVIDTAVKEVTGISPRFSTDGGTSDGRFLKDVAPVIELGLCNRFAHHADERVPVKDLENLTLIYREILSNLADNRLLQDQPDL